MGLSRSEDILEATINGDEYDQPPQSRIEKLLIDLKDTISGGGGGGNTKRTKVYELAMVPYDYKKRSTRQSYETYKVILNVQKERDKT